MKTDAQIQQDVIDELLWEPQLNTSEIGVTVTKGIVTLSGKVDSYYKKIKAEKTAKKVAGVKAVAEDIEVGILSTSNKSDTEIADAVLKALKWHTAVKEDKIKIEVENGIVKLDGEVEWEYQKNNAKIAIQNLRGVKLVINSIIVKPKVSPHELEQKISAAFHRSATIDSRKITAEVDGSKVILRGKVRSFAENDDAEDAAWAAPGVLTVVNELEIEEPEYAYES